MAKYTIVAWPFDDVVEAELEAAIQRILRAKGCIVPQTVEEVAQAEGTINVTIMPRRLLVPPSGMSFLKDARDGTCNQPVP